MNPDTTTHIASSPCRDLAPPDPSEVVYLPTETPVPQVGNTFVDVVVEDLVPYLDAFDPVESLLVLNELQRRLAELEQEYQAYANWEADDAFAA